MNFDSLRADIRYWGWLRSLLIRVMSRLGKHTGLRVYRVNVRPLVRRARAEPPGGYQLAGRYARGAPESSRRPGYPGRQASLRYRDSTRESKFELD